MVWLRFNPFEGLNLGVQRWSPYSGYMKVCKKIRLKLYLVDFQVLNDR